MGPSPSPSHLAQTFTIYIYHDDLINDNLRNLIIKKKEQTKERLELQLVFVPCPLTQFGHSAWVYVPYSLPLHAYMSYNADPVVRYSWVVSDSS